MNRLCDQFKQLMNVSGGSFKVCYLMWDHSLTHAETHSSQRGTSLYRMQHVNVHWSQQN